jgi:hypothetical protein
MKRRVFQSSHGNRSVKVFRDTEWQEYIVRYYWAAEKGGQPVLYESADYHCDDKAEAIATAEHYLKSGTDFARPQGDQS